MARRVVRNASTAESAANAARWPQAPRASGIEDHLHQPRLVPCIDQHALQPKEAPGGCELQQHARQQAERGQQQDEPQEAAPVRRAASRARAARRGRRRSAWSAPRRGPGGSGGEAAVREPVAAALQARRKQRDGREQPQRDHRPVGRTSISQKLTSKAASASAAAAIPKTRPAGRCTAGRRRRAPRPGSTRARGRVRPRACARRGWRTERAAPAAPARRPRDTARTTLRRARPDP